MKSKIIHFVLMFAFFFIGYFIINESLGFIPDGVVIAAPWAVVGLMQLPLSYCIQAILKTNEVNDHSSLTNSELRRLSPLVKSKRRLMISLLALYVSSTLFVVLGLMVSAGTQELLYKVLRVSGGLLFVSLYTSLFVHRIMIEIQSFKAILNRRDSDKKERESLLDKLK